jgi:hypothetical protein
MLSLWVLSPLSSISCYSTAYRGDKRIKDVRLLSSRYSVTCSFLALAPPSVPASPDNPAQYIQVQMDRYWHSIVF